MHRYRSHTCGALREGDIGKVVRLSGWCHRIRDHGGVLFIDLRDHYGLTQCVVDPDSPAFAPAEKLRSEWVVRIDGKVRRRPEGTDNPELSTGTVEIYVSEIEVLGAADLFFEVDVLAREAILERGNLAKGQRILERHRDLCSRVRAPVQFVRRERIGGPAVQHHEAEKLTPRSEGNETRPFQP